MGLLFLSASVLAAQNQPAAYAGSATCQPCHDDVFQAFQRNPHHQVEADTKRGWQGRACESCHGPGAKHAESAAASDILNPARLSPPETDQTCLKCHLNQPTHASRLQNSHARNQVACTACHAMHKGAEALRPTRPAAVNQRCARCHNSEWAQFQKPYKHRLPEGAMSCTDCHNPHGSPLKGSIRTVSGNQPVCFRCHGDKRGPFTYEHPPVRTDGCQRCHEPHGSANPRMLVRHQTPMVCLECHANIGAQRTIGGVPPAFHDLRTAQFQNCTVCHIKIHGSYVSAAFER
ncbi:MAG: DmsE family decaheme c-type cytochrome [Bryobacteraceae bacterium]|jgi:DmsE family decaheme c-type cytochrome